MRPISQGELVVCDLLKQNLEKTLISGCELGCPSHFTLRVSQLHASLEPRGDHLN